MPFLKRNSYWLIAVAFLLGGLITFGIYSIKLVDERQDYAAWAQVLGGMLAIVGAVFGSALHSEQQAKIAAAERMKAAYLISRAAGGHVVDVDRWLRHGAGADSEQFSKDMERVRNYPSAWEAWIEDRYDAYLETLNRIDLDTLSDGAFLDNVLSIRSRLKWLKLNVSPNVGRSSIDADQQRRLGLAARDVLKALAEMRQRADKALKHASLPTISSAEAEPFPSSSPPPVLKLADHEKWHVRIKAA